MSRQSGLLANDKGDNEMIPRAAHISPGICFTPEKIVDEGCATSQRYKWGPLLINEVGRISQQVQKGEGREKEEDRVGNHLKY